MYTVLEVKMGASFQLIWLFEKLEVPPELHYISTLRKLGFKHYIDLYNRSIYRSK